MKQTLVIGSAVVDVIVNIPHLPVTGEDIHISKQTRALGGCAYIASDILRHFKTPYSLCTAVGGGIYGNFVLDELTKRNVPVYVRREDAENGCCYCMVEEGGERTFIVDHGIEYTFDESYLKNIDTTTIDSVYLCGLEIEEKTGAAILAYLKKHPDYTLYFAPSPRIMKIPKEKMDEMFSLSPIVHLNEQELLAFTGEKDVPKGARALFQKTRNAVIVTLGEKGSYCFDGADFFAPGVKTTVVDTIGAGDSHMGAIMAARRFGLSFQDAITVANHISAAVVAKEGGLLEDIDFANVLSTLPAPLKNKLS